MTGRLNTSKHQELIQQSTKNLDRLVGKLVNFYIPSLYAGPYWKVETKKTSLYETYDDSLTSVILMPVEAAVLLAEVEYEEKWQRWFCLVLHPEHGLLVKIISVEWAAAIREVEP